MMQTTSDIREAIGILRNMPAATIYEAAGKSGALHTAIQTIGRAVELAGPAFPVRCEPYETLPVLRAIDRATPGDVLVVDAGEDGATVWGGTSTIAAQVRGIAGLVTNGSIRDCAEVMASGFPVFACGRSLRGTHKNHAGDIGQPVVLSGQCIAQGDFVRGDADGVVIVPAERIVAVATAALIQRDKEEALDAAIRNGGQLTALLGL